MVLLLPYVYTLLRLTLFFFLFAKIVARCLLPNLCLLHVFLRAISGFH